MRVVMLIANPITYDGRVLRHAQTLSQAGHQVTVIGVVGPSDRAEPPQQVCFAWQRIDRRRRGVVPRLRWFGSALRQRAAHLLCSRMPPSALTFLPGLGALAVATSAPELVTRAVPLRPEVVHANDLNTLPAAAWAARICRGKYVYDAHELYPDENPDLSAAERRIRSAVEGSYLGSAAAVLTVNGLIADELASRYGVARPAVLRNLPCRVAVPSPETRPLGTTGALRLLYHGAHIGLEQHGVDDILRAMARLHGRFDMTLTMRGGLRPAEAEALRERARQLGILDLLRIVPPVSGGEALVEAAVADGAEVGLAVHPPLSQSYVYTTSSKLYEYQAAGLAICASDVLGNRHTAAAGAGVFYPPGDDQELAARLSEMATDKRRLRAMQQAAFEHAQAELCWEREGTRLLDIYEEFKRQKELTRQRGDVV